MVIRWMVLGALGAALGCGADFGADAGGDEPDASSPRDSGSFEDDAVRPPAIADAAPADAPRENDSGSPPSDAAAAEDGGAPAMDAGTPRWLVAEGWTNVDIGARTGTLRVEFDMRTTAARVDAVVGLASAYADAYAELAAIVRFSPEGVVDARDDGAYRADERVQYVAGAPVSVRMEIQIDDGTYDVFVDQGEGERLILENGGFRDAMRPERLTHLAMYEPSNDLRIANLRVNGSSAPLVPEDDEPVMPVDPPSDALLSVNFDDTPLGDYSADDIRRDWPGTRWANPFGRVDVQEEGGNRYVRVSYPRGGVGPSDGGAQWFVELPESYDELYLSYRMRFRDGFDFVRGGKLPGLAGGEANTGLRRPNGRDGWSARMMWRNSGRAVQYVYHPDQPERYGEDMIYNLGGERRFPRGAWVRVEHRIVMNDPGSRNGQIRAWYDGVLALDRTGVRFRDTDEFAIDVFYFSTFFGGASPDWAPSRDEWIDFDDFVVSSTPASRR